MSRRMLAGAAIAGAALFAAAPAATASTTAPTSAQLQKQLLTTGQLGSGWTKQSVTPQVDPGSTACGHTAEAFPKPSGQAEAYYVHSATPQREILEAVVGYSIVPVKPTNEAVAKWEACRSGGGVTGHVMQFPALGAARVAWAGKTTGSGTTYYLDLAIVRKGDRVLVIEEVGPSAINAQRFVTISERAVSDLGA